MFKEAITSEPLEVQLRRRATARLPGNRLQVNAALCRHGVRWMTRRVSRLQLLLVVPAVLAGQSNLPRTSTELAGADRASWVAALAAACDTVSVDSTWRAYRVPRAEFTIQLPAALAERGEILRGVWYDEVPAFPERDYALEHYDPVTSRLILQHATFVFRCHAAERGGPVSLSGIWVAGYDSRSREDPTEGVWYVVGSWQSRGEWLYGMSRDLWGARALVTSMMKAEFSATLAAPSPR
jgi:hypothetical protein